jgi:hypothetical protein
MLAEYHYCNQKFNIRIAKLGLFYNEENSFFIKKQSSLATGEVPYPVLVFEYLMNSTS